MKLRRQKGSKSKTKSSQAGHFEQIGVLVDKSIFVSITFRIFLLSQKRPKNNMTKNWRNFDTTIKVLNLSVELIDSVVNSKTISEPIFSFVGVRINPL